MWFDIYAALSKERSHEIGVNFRDSTAEKMTPEQISEAQELAKEWLAKHNK